MFKIFSNDKIEKNLISKFFVEHWGSPEMVVSSGIYHCDQLNGYASLNKDNEINGLITYIIKGEICEIISLDSIEERKGIGTSLVNRVESIAKTKKCKYVNIITTNDNLNALAFYQKRGYRIIGIEIDAVEKARRIKPEIPLVSDEGIPIKDEILLAKELNY